MLHDVDREGELSSELSTVFELTAGYHEYLNAKGNFVVSEILLGYQARFKTMKIISNTTVAILKHGTLT